MLRKNVSISDAHLKMLDPLLKKHQGNLSAAMRDIIDFTGFVTENMGSLETAKDLFKEKNHAMEQTRNRIYGVTIPLTMFRWLLTNRTCNLPPLNEVTGIDPEINSFYANLIAIFLANNKTPLKISKLLEYPASIYMLFSGALSHEEAAQSIYEAFNDNNKDALGGKNEVMLVSA
ncbi:MAG: hypothetical protein O8C62_04385 [Candidatus Methanoperedens sp.]|nr:hypothetical protein [Candidatus Methanoperedens sp.]